MQVQVQVLSVQLTWCVGVSFLKVGRFVGNFAGRETRLFELPRMITTIGIGTEIFQRIRLYGQAIEAARVWKESCRYPESRPAVNLAPSSQKMRRKVP